MARMSFLRHVSFVSLYVGVPSVISAHIYFN